MNIIIGKTPQIIQVYMCGFVFPKKISLIYGIYPAKVKIIAMVQNIAVYFIRDSRV